MSSIFDLKTSVEQLSSANQGTSRMEYDQHPPTRDVTLNNFPNGAIHFRWTTSGQKWWIPSRSYLRIRCKLSKANGSQLSTDDGIAPNMGLCASLFQSAEFRINDKTVSRISDFMPQIDALETRISKSRSWLQGVGKSVNLWQPDFRDRQTVVASDSDKKEDEVLGIVGRLELGYAAGVTISLAADTGVVTFSAASSQGQPFRVGDEIEITDGAGAVTRRRISAVAGNGLTVTLNGDKSNAIAAAVLDFKRIRQLSPNESRAVSEFELIWSPPLSIFKLGHGLPSMKAELVLNPQTSSVYQKYAIQSDPEQADKVPNLGTEAAPNPANADYLFQVQDMYFYCNTVSGPRADDITYLLDLDTVSCQSEQFSAGQTSFQQKNFDVSPSTYALTACYQDSRSGTDTRRSASIFRSATVAGVDGEESKINRLFINYAGQNFPSPDADPSFDSTKDNTTQRYVASQIYSGAIYDSGGAESIEEWRKRGAYYLFATPRDGTDASTRVNVHQSFQAGTDTTNMRVLLFSHSKQVARVRVQDGRVAQVDLEDA